MNKTLKRFITIKNKPLFLNQLSIKNLTLLGFSLVVLPLTLALLYSASQVNHLAQQGSSAIINVAQLVETNRQISSTFNKIQRFASQYIVLREPDLLVLYQEQTAQLTQLLEQNLSQYHHQPLNALANSLVNQLKQLSLSPTSTDNKEKALSAIEHEFKSLSNLVQEIDLESNQLINSQVSQMKDAAGDVTTTILHSLVIIPLTIALAVIFALLIMRPLKLLSRKIKRLEQGHFEEKFVFTGTKEIKEIADALELMRRRLHALELQKSSFIRHISHELKTPLAAIREGTELLYDNSVGPLNTDQQEITNIIKHSVSRLQQLIEDLLDFNIVLDSTSLQDAEQVELSSLIEQCCTLRKLDLQSKALSISSNYQAIILKSNPKQLSVILDNLLSNAIKYSPLNSTISITTMQQNEQVSIRICDQGPGISPTIQDKIFDAFYHGPAPEQSNIKSSGLGLTIVKELLMRLNGEIRLDNQASPKSGLCVTVSFPLH